VRILCQITTLSLYLSENLSATPKPGAEEEKRVFKRGFAPLFNNLPPPLPREGDKGGGFLFEVKS